MPLPAYMKLQGIEGGSKVQGREGTCEVLGFHHEVYMPTDRKDGTSTGTRIHKGLSVIKNFDKASPDLYKRLCNGQTVPSVEIWWYKIEDDGTEKKYFVHKMTNARIISMRPYMPDIDNPSNEQYKHMEEVTFRYDKIQWEFTEGGMMFEDSWTEGR